MPNVALPRVAFRRLTVVGLVLAVAASTGCARGAKSENASESAKPTNADAPAHPMRALGYRPEWKGYPQVDPKAGIKFIDVLGDSVAVHDNRNILTVMEPGSGRNRWSLDLGSPLMKFVGTARAADDLYACSESEIQILDVRTGQIKARQRLSTLTNTRPVVTSGVAVFGCATGEVLGHSLVTGYKAWGYKLDGTVSADPVAVGDSVAVVSQAGDVIILDPRTGESFGRRRTIFGGLSNDPVATDSAVYIAGTDQSVWAFSVGGKPIWRVRTSDRLEAQPALHDNALILTIPSAGLTALDTGTGAKLWSSPDISGQVIAVRNSRLVVWDRSAKTLMTVDARHGDIVAHAPVPNVTVIATDKFIDGDLYLGNKDGSVDRLSTR